MKKYGAMRFVAGLLSFIGWVVIALAVLFFIVIVTMNQNLPASQYANPAVVMLIAIVISGLIALMGVFSIASGQLIAAQADIATNSGYLRQIAANTAEMAAHTERTAGFFERATARQGDPEVRVPAVPRP
jgi:hypothetical protein